MILVIWWEIPESVEFVVLPSKYKDTVEKFHNRFINSDDDCEEINDFFYEDDGEFKFTKTKEMINDRHFDLIIITGFCL